MYHNNLEDLLKMWISCILIYSKVNTIQDPFFLNAYRHSQLITPILHFNLLLSIVANCLMYM